MLQILEKESPENIFRIKLCPNIFNRVQTFVFFKTDPRMYLTRILYPIGKIEKSFIN